MQCPKIGGECIPRQAADSSRVEERVNTLPRARDYGADIEDLKYRAASEDASYLRDNKGAEEAGDKMEH